MDYYTSFKDLIQNTKCALIVIDKQNAYAHSDFFHLTGKTPQKNAEAVLKNIDDFIEWARVAQLPVAWTRMIEDPKSSPAVVAQRMIIDQSSTISQKNTPGYAYYGLTPLAPELEVDKYFPDAFSESKLAKWLTKNGVQTVLLVGGFASRCVLATAFGAQLSGFNPVVVSDLTLSPKQFEDEVPASHKIINGVVGYVKTATELKSLL